MPGYPGYTPGGGIGDAFTNPLEGQPRAIQGLGTGGSVGWGIALCSIWIFAFWGILARMSSLMGFETEFQRSPRVDPARLGGRDHAHPRPVRDQSDG